MGNYFRYLLKRFLHDPIDKPFDIITHEKRARESSEILGVSGVENFENQKKFEEYLQK